MEYRILIVEDEQGIARAVCSAMARWGLNAEAVTDFRHVMEDFERVQPHLVLLDISLPFMNGYHWCTEIRKVSAVPVIFVSSASDNMNIIMAMNMGADDFIAKPFDPDVLVAKVQALLRRSYDFAGSAPVLEHRGIVLNTGDNTLTCNGQKLDLSRNEYRILLTLMQNKGKIVSREKLMEALWQTDSFVDENTLTVNVGRLRKKLEAAGVNMKGIKEEKKSQVFENMTICVTGSFDNYSRNDVTRIIEENSGKASSSVSKKTTFLVAGENAGSKLTKAQELGIEIKTIEEFISMVEEGKKE